MNKRKILFTLQSLNLGGIEISLVNLLLKLDRDKYDITVITQNVKGELLDKIPSHVHVVHYRKSEHANVFLRKIYNRTKIFYWTMRYRNRFDVAVAYCGYCIPSALLARSLGKKSYMWVHTDHMTYFCQDKQKYCSYFSKYKIEAMEHIIFVSKRACLTFIQIYPALKDRCLVIKNQMQVDVIKEKSDAFEVVLSKHKEIVFFNVARHEEDSKRITRILYACAQLKKEGYSFQFASIGDGIDHTMYVELAKELNLEDVVTFYGEQKNPYPYFKAGDVFILSSEYEGDPVVIYEAMILGKNIISTDVGDLRDLISSSVGSIVEKNEIAIYEVMKKYINYGIINYTFDYDKINQTNMEQIEALFSA